MQFLGSNRELHSVGGTVYAGENLGDVFHTIGVAPDFDYTKPDKDPRILFAHRKLADGDIY